MSVNLGLPNGSGGIKAGCGKASSIGGPGAGPHCSGMPTLQHCRTDPGLSATLFCPDSHTLVPTAAGQSITCKKQTDLIYVSHGKFA